MWKPLASGGVILMLTLIVLSATISVNQTAERQLGDEDKTSVDPISPRQKESGTPDCIVWNKTYGGRRRDLCHALSPTDDDGFIIIGETYSYDRGGGDLWLIRIDGWGNELWNTTLGATRTDYGFAGHQTADGGYIVVGGTTSFGAGDHDVWLVKTDPKGDEEWNRTYGGPDRDQGCDVHQTADGGYIIVGGTMSFGWGPNDYWLIKTDAVGNEIWNRTYGGNGRDWGYAIIPTADGGFVFTGGTDVSLNAAHILDIGVYKTDAHGTLEWERLFNRPVGLQHWDEGYDIKLTADGGYLISGIAHTTVAGGWSETGGGDGWLIKTDAEGRKEWDRVVGGDATDMFVAALPTNDGGYIVSGSTFSFSRTGCRAWLMKTDAVGDDVWDIMLEESESGPALLGHNIQLTSDGGYLMACATSTYGAGSWDIWLVKVIDPALQLEMQEGSGLAVLITNAGNAPLFNLTWTVEIEMTGVLTSEQNLQGTIASLASGEVATLQLAPFGLGMATIRVTADGVGKTATYMMIGPFLMAP